MSSPDFIGRTTAPHAAVPPAPLRIVVVKWDMLNGDILHGLASRTFPGADVTLCRSGADALDCLRRRPAMLGLFGLTLPDIDGLDLLELVADEQLVQRRLIVTGRRDERSRRALRTAPVQGVFDAFAEDSEALVDALLKIAAGGRYFSATLCGEAPPPPGSTSPFVEVLSFVEQQVFAMIGEGAGNEEISTRLGICEHTIRSHCGSISLKLALKSPSEFLDAARARR